MESVTLPLVGYSRCITCSKWQTYWRLYIAAMLALSFEFMYSESIIIKRNWYNSKRMCSVHLNCFNVKVVRIEAFPIPKLQLLFSFPDASGTSKKRIKCLPDCLGAKLLPVDKHLHRQKAWCLDAKVNLGYSIVRINLPLITHSVMDFIIANFILKALQFTFILSLDDT